MNSYPHEFLSHPLPLMFVAGITDTTTTRARNDSITSQGHGDAAPGNANTSTDQSSRGDGVAVDIAATQPDEQLDTSDPFNSLAANLRTAFSAFSEKPNVWKQGYRLDRSEAAGSRRGSREDPAAERTRLFRVLVVDKNVRIPPRKARPPPSATPTPQTPQNPSLYPSIPPPSIAHSPHSPLTPTSPTYPDGIMNPSWIRKHEDHVPCVIVLFLRLPAAVGMQEKEEGDAGKRQAGLDDALALEIGERRRKWVERVPGVKVTVVLMASKEMLDDPALDARLSAIRRQSGLDTKSSLYVLTPVAAEDLDDFVQSLQQAVYPHAMDLFATHYRANRKKRAKLPANPQAVPYPATAPPGGRPLNTQGWAARYDYKAGWWAEGRGDVDLARRHYEDAWQALCYLFGVKDALPPRTKRWLEAKVLADCIAVKICRLAFYRNDPPAALSFFHQHLNKFGEFSVAWGIGKDSFEFWSWIGRQYRMFAELLELVIAHGLKIQAPLPAYAVPNTLASGGNTTEEVLVSAVKPLLVLQNPGYYYYTAGNCAVQRKVMFERAIASESKATQASTTALNNEKKVDHTGIIVELYTKAYNLLQARPGKNRLALYIAYRIAETQSEGGQYDEAMTFLRKIAHVYEEERWNPIVWSIRSLWYECAQRTGTADDAARLLLEMMAPYGSERPEDPRQYQEDLDVLLKTTAPSSAEPIKITQPSSNALVRIQAGLLKSEAIVNTEIPFLVELYAPENVQFERLQFNSLQIEFSNGKTCRVDHMESSETNGCPDLGEVKDEVQTIQADLSFSPGEVKLFHGTVRSRDTGPLEFREVALVIARNSWTIHLANKSVDNTALVIGDLDDEIYPSINVLPRPLDLDIHLDHSSKAFATETIGFVVSVTSSESKAFKLSYEIEAIQAKIMPRNAPQAECQDRSGRLDFGQVKPGEKISQPISLKYVDAGDHQLRITFYADLVEDPIDRVDLTCTKTTTISISIPFQANNLSRYDPSATPPISLLSAERLKPDFFEKIAQGIFYTRILQNTDVDLTIHNIEYTHTDGMNSRLAQTSLDICKFPDDWEAGLLYGIMNYYDIALRSRPPAQGESAEDATAGFLDISWSRKDAEGTIDHFICPVPAMRYTPQDSVQVVIKAPPFVTQYSSFQWQLEVTNVHPTIPAKNLSIQTEITEGFSWTGSRHVAVPTLMPFQQFKYAFSAIPMASPGLHPLPRVRLLQAESEIPREVPIQTKNDVNSEGAVRVFVKPL